MIPNSVKPKFMSSEAKNSLSKFFILSIVAHAVIIGLFGSVVIFQYIFQQDQQFEAVAPPVTVEARKLEHRVRVQEQQRRSGRPQMQPRLAAASISDIALPDLKSEVRPVRNRNLTQLNVRDLGVGTGMGGFGGAGTGTAFGFAQRVEGSLEGTFYDLKQDRNRQPTNVTNIAGYCGVLEEFLRSWNESVLQKFYTAPDKLYATQLFIPLMEADEAPKAFNVEDKVEPERWMILYRGNVSPPADGRYRFVGYADNLLVVRVNKKVVLDGSRDNSRRSGWSGTDFVNEHSAANGMLHYGTWVQFNARDSYEIEVLLGENPGGGFAAFLLVQQEGETYEERPDGGPILPPFRVGLDVPVIPEGRAPPYKEDAPLWRPGRRSSFSIMQR